MPGRRDNEDETTVEPNDGAEDGPQPEPSRDDEKKSRAAYEEYANAPEEPGEPHSEQEE